MPEKNIDNEVGCALMKHRGRQNAIHARALAREVGSDERSVRDAVSRLIDDRGLSIGSHPSVGFFMIVTRQDLELACRHLLSRGSKILHRLAVLKKIGHSEAARQLYLFKEG